MQSTPSTSEINSEINTGDTSVGTESISQISHISHSSPTKAEDKQKILGKSPSVSKNTINNNFSRRSIGVQVIQKLVNPHFRSKSTMCTPCMTDASCQT